MGGRQAWARRCTYWLEPKNWLIVTVAAIGWHADGWAGVGWGLLAALFTAVLPTLFISYGVRQGRWSDRNVGARRPRLVVLAFITASVAAGLAVLAAGGAPRLLTGYLAFMLASVAVLALVTVVWKISIHCAVASGSVAILAMTYGPLVLCGYVLVGLLGWSRVALKDHTVAQVVAGSVLGAGAAALAYALLAWLTSGAGTGALAGRQQDSTTASGQVTCTTPTARSASPTWWAPRISSVPNQASKANCTATAAAAGVGRRAHGTAGPRLAAPAGQRVSPANPIEAKTKCGTEPKPPACSGLAATIMPAAAPPISISRPGVLAGRSASAVTM
jgi:membrane-associated phospholipid phosphatase